MMTENMIKEVEEDDEEENKIPVPYSQKRKQHDFTGGHSGNSGGQSKHSGGFTNSLRTDFSKKQLHQHHQPNNR